MTYRIRKNFREWEGTFSEKQVIQEITRGKLSGDDEFCAEGKSEWKLISSQPRFYDALLRRLFQEQYPIQGQESSVSKPKRSGFSEPEATRREKGTKTHRAEDEADGDAEVAGATAALPDGERAPEGATLHQAEIDELFSDVAAPAADGAPPAERSLALTLPPDPAGAESPPLEIDLPVPASQNPDNENFVARFRGKFKVDTLQKKPSKRLLVYGGVALLLVLLFFSGGEKPKPVVVEKKKPPFELYTSLTDPRVKKETLLALQRQGDILYDWHTPLFYYGAREVYNQALTLDEGNCELLGSLAEAGARLLPESGPGEGIEEQVRQFIARGRLKEPHFAQFYRAEALLALYRGELMKAREAIQHAKEVDPANLENVIVEGEVLLGSHLDSDAENYLKKVVDEDSYSIQARALLSIAKLRKRDYAGAREQAIAVLKLNPIHAGSYFVLGSIAFEQDKIPEAEQQYETFVGLAKFASREELFSAYYRLGIIQENRGNKEKAREDFRLAYYYVPERKTELGDRVKDLDLSDQALSALARKNEYGISYYRERAESLLLRKNYRHSLIFLHATHLMNPGDGTALVRIGDVAEKLADNYIEFRAVTSYYERAIEEDPTLTSAYIKLGLLETDLYNLDRAFTLLKHAQTISPNRAEPYVALGRYYYKARDYVSSIEQFTKAFNINPSDPEIHYYAGLLRPLGKSGGEKEAMVFFYRAYLLNPTYYEAMIEWLKLKVKNYDKLFATKFVRNLLEQDPGNANLYWALGEIYATNKEHRRAIDYFKKSLELDRFVSGVRLSMAKSLEAVGELEKAVLEYRLVTRLDRRNGEGSYHAAEILMEAKRFDLAEDVLNELIQISPNFPGAYRYMARIYQAKKKKDQAIEYMKREVKNNPLNAKFRLEYAGLLMDYQEYEPAITELTEVTNLASSKNAEYVYEKIRAYLFLSRCYRALNQPEGAEGAIGLALEIDPEDPELHRELGFVYSGQQRSREAIRELEFYLNRNPAASDAANVRTMIQNMKVEE